MEMKPEKTRALHVLLFPFPLQGHVTPMLELAELLSLAGLRITFVNTEHIHRRLLRHSPTVTQLSRSPNFHFRTISDGLPEDDPRPFLGLLELEFSMRTRCRDSYRELLRPTAGKDPDAWPPVTCVVADGILRLALEVAEEVGIPVIFFRTSSSCSFWAYHCIPKLLKEGELPFPEGADLDEMIRSVPGMETFLRRRDLPGFCRKAVDSKDQGLQFVATVTANTTRAKALILNTFESLESPVLLSHISSVYPIIYSLGPLHSLLHTVRPGGVGDAATALSSTGLWEEDRTCMSWLDLQPIRSVVYVSFGSLAVVSSEQLLELWHGLVNSGQRFLWVVRSDMVGGGDSEERSIPDEVEKGTRARGCLVEWAPQVEVLAHPAVGCFLTHSGWNSTLESVAAGVPMICWPYFADQLINSRFVGEVWRVGVDMKDRCERDVVEKMVRSVMEEGRVAAEIRRSTAELAEMARRSVGEGGSSYVNLGRLVQYIKLLSLESS